MKTATLCAWIALAAGLSSCANIKVRPIANTHGSSGLQVSSETSGVRFYRPALHVWITSGTLPDKVNIKTDVQSKTTKDTTTTGMEVTDVDSTTAVVPAMKVPAYQARFEWLPDYSQEYIITWSSGMGSVSPSFSLENGWNLTGFESSVDSKTSENITAIASLATSAAGALTSGPTWQGAGLYRMAVGPNGELMLGPRVLALE